MPPLCSIVLMPRGVRRRRTEWPSASDRTEATWRFDMNRRFDLLLAWLTWWPYWTDLPDRAQRRGMAASAKKRTRRRAGRRALYGPGAGPSSYWRPLILKAIPGLSAGRIALRRTSRPRVR